MQLLNRTLNLQRISRFFTFSGRLTHVTQVISSLNVANVVVLETLYLLFNNLYENPNIYIVLKLNIFISHF